MTAPKKWIGAALGMILASVAFSNRGESLHAALQRERLIAELSCGRPTFLASAPPDARALERFDWRGLLRTAATGEPLERSRAIEILGELRDPRAVPALLAALGGARGTLRPCLAAQSLGQLGDARALDALIAATRDRENEDLRLCSIKALGLLRSPSAVPALVDALERRDMLVATAFALARIGDPRGAGALARVAEDRTLAPWLIEPLGELASADAARALQTISVALETGPATRALAREGLWKQSMLGAGDRAHTLARVLEREPSARRRAWAAWRLGDEGITAGTEALTAALADPEAPVRLAAAAALLRLGSASEASLLGHLDASGEEGDLAVAALGFVGTQRSVTALAARTQRGDPRNDLALMSLRWLHLRGVRMTRPTGGG